MKFIEEVEHVFDIRGRGCVIVPGIPYDFKPEIGINSILEFQNPSGTKIRTTIQAFEMINRGKPVDYAPFSLPRNIRKTDIELRAKIYLVDNE
jgi:hypothetical protein